MFNETQYSQAVERGTTGKVGRRRVTHVDKSGIDLAIHLPAVETLSIHDSGSGMPHESIRRSRVASDEVQTRADFLSADPISQTSHYFDGIKAYSAAGATNGRIDYILKKNKSKGNFYWRSGEPNTMIDLKEIPETPTRDSVKRPLKDTQESPPLSVKRKRRSIASFDDMKGLFDTRATNYPVPSHSLSTEFTPVNRRRSIKLGDLRSSKRAVRFPSLVSENELASVGYDGPLISKQISDFSHAQDGVSGKYPFPQPSLLTSTFSTGALTGPLQTVSSEVSLTARSMSPPRVSSPNRDTHIGERIRRRGLHNASNAAALVRAAPIEISEVSMAAHSTSGRRITSFDWEEHNLNVEESMANRGFRSARAFEESIQKRRAAKADIAQASGDLSDSIRTAHR